MRNEIKIFSPATVANVSCGFDVLGFCLDNIGDEMIIKKTPQKGIRITKIEGYDLPLNPLENVAGVSALALLEEAKPNFGFEIEIYKKIKPGSGIGSSSASASGSVFAINELLGKPYNTHQLTAFAMKGEALASGAEHADNIAPALFGGFTLVKSCNPISILKLPTPAALYATIIHPEIEIKTRHARSILPDQIPLKTAITQWANVGSLVHALHTNNYQLLSSALQDVVIEPYRKTLIPHFDTVKKQTLRIGALGCGISGSGPSVFALSEGLEMAKNVEKVMRDIYFRAGITFTTYVSKINPTGIKIL
ncbi:homoserine kinase [Bizionia gelidisalsuginis]|uniref:Homoserine kinase n=2 Tax=Bizionia TaxID=283785 RepID=A0A8H2LAI7_9FLAO|nr:MULTISPECIES: homoserine kinase [Bizionia]TYB70030.1 homoserine kinase [Bizionia saleffrena]TYC10123.1 homoserine kinase [Bizionia gelidisalsuginis]